MSETKTKDNKKPGTAVTKVSEFSFIKDELVKIGNLKKGFNENQLKFVRDAVNKDLTDVELLVALSFCTKLQLNPILGEVVIVVYYKDDPSKRRVGYIVPRDGKRVVAARSGGLESVTKDAIYIKEVTILSDDNTKNTVAIKRVQPWEGGTLWGATATVVRSGVPYTVTVPLTEYDTKLNVWKTKPETMIKKVAESQALTAAYPELLGGIYDESESESIGNGKKVLEVPNGDEPVTVQQIEALEAQGINVPDDLTKSEAVELLTSKPKKVKEEKTNE